ncbi:MAG: winged helix-turn-helix domain-containing protein [Candidatus Marinimicrobia bacterium]|nr:winged helix-turn-helix domain-containing protein [Candidatus Neomarinimicrobiota bacterium]
MNIGAIAGKIWKTLEKEGAMTVSALVKSTGAANNDVLMGLGWLMREDKLTVTKAANCTKYGLK